MRIRPESVSASIRRLGCALLVAGFLPVAQAWAQDVEYDNGYQRAALRIGIKGGLNFATFSNAAPNLDRQTGFAAGASLPIRLNGVLDFQPEALFVQKGPETQEIRYIEVPAFLRFNLPVEQFSPFLLGGGYAAFRLSCDFGTGTDDCPPEVAKRDYGVSAGAGVRLGGRMGFTLEGRYTWGLKDVHQVTAGFDQRNRSFLILAGLEF